MKRRRLVISSVSAALLAVAAAAPVAAQTPSCVGWFASTSAQEDGRDFAGLISESARAGHPFGRSVVAPFAHLPLEDCQGGD